MGIIDEAKELRNIRLTPRRLLAGAAFGALVVTMVQVDEHFHPNNVEPVEAPPISEDATPVDSL